MIFPLICVIVGAAMMGKTKAQTRVSKMVCLGSKSGVVYQVEDFPEVGAIVVRAPQKLATALFLRANVREPGKPGLIYQHGSGDARILDLMRKDFGLEVRPPPVAVADKKAEAS